MRRAPAIGLALASLAGAGAVTVSAAASAQDAAQALQRAQRGLSAVRDGEADEADSVAALRRASSDVERANAELAGWPVDVLAAVPVLGRSWDAERAVARTAREVLAGALVLADGLPDVRARPGGVDLTALEQVRRELAGPARRGRAELTRLRSTPDGLTPPQVGRGLAAASSALGPAVETLERTHTGLGVATGLLGASGPRSVLVALQNNAELRGAGGYVSTFGTGRLEGGRLSLDPLQDLVDVADPPEQARRVPSPPEYAEDYGPLSGDTTIWRSWNMSPHVPDSALVGSRIAGTLLGRAPDVVVLLDVPAMGELASLGGNAVVLPDGTKVSADELTDALLVESYAQAGSDGDDQVQRRDDLREAATAAVGRLLAGELPAVDLLRTLTRLAGGRHLTVWSARPDEQAALVDLGLAGAVETPAGGDLSHVSLNNIGANKLDVYADRRITVDVRLEPDRAHVVQRVTVANDAPQGLVPYVAGVQRPGTMVSRAELSLPTTATEVSATVDGRPWPEAPRTGAARQRLATRVETPRGRTTVLEARYVLPVRDGRYRLRLLPQPLAEQASLSLSVRGADGRALDVVEGAGLDDGAVVEPAAPFPRTREVVVRLAGSEQSRSRWDRLEELWTSPGSDS
ncbi:MAG: hypothetical protein AVDCRST_MAG16-214 [uncultured Frankineae bacterium]|uniref:DUF4012 domain-containing protein n=1 Tax=uncultured Frankineae bacterium TaxID=437475 RepID=A0A6J4KPM4_9ACTN|nr:MAG: hypothetical protein AVDCRST_MAG16-214 [uncultured Frankineae bacterium]